jgi:predicted Abi (CAAX) family protease
MDCQTSLRDCIWEILGWVFWLDKTAFDQISISPWGIGLALGVALLAEFSLAVGQSVVLFINRVTPLRFIFSLLISAALYVFEFLFQVISTWLICQLPWSVHPHFLTLLMVFGLSYAPLLFGFLGALPYLGFPILRLLSIWNLLAITVGFATLTQTSLSIAFGYVAFGWFAKELLINTIGQPIAKLGERLATWGAGVALASNKAELAAIIETAVQGFSSAAIAASAESNSSIFATKVEGSATAVQRFQGDLDSDRSSLAVNANGVVGRRAQKQWMGLEYRWQQLPQAVRLGLLSGGMVLLFVIVALLLRPVREGLFGWRDSFPSFMRWFIDLTWIGIIALIFAGLLAPLETMGWWAGWYGDQVDTRLLPAPGQSSVGDRSDEDAGKDTSDRYIVYLDGVGQSGEEYTPDVAEFLQTLQPVLPANMKLVQGLMMYSVFNKPLDQDRPLAWLWRLADKMRWQNPTTLLGMMVNLRNILIVAVSADQRYGPIFNLGIAQVLYNGLIKAGYKQQTPITLIGYSGGGQMAVAAAPYLKRVLGTQIDVISLGGVISANINVLKLQHLYHLVGDHDGLARSAPLFFPGRSQFFKLSYWNRALRKGRISLISLGPMGHQVPGGMMDPNAFLPSGQSNLQHTIATILSILEGRFLVAHPPRPRLTSNYEHYKQAEFNDYSYYPLSQTVDPRWYRPIAPWMGRLILPELSQRHQVRGVWLEVHHAGHGYESLVGQRVILRWSDEAIVQQKMKAATRDVHFSVDAEYANEYGGSIHPERLNHWQQVDPLESLAGAHPQDDLIVMLAGAVAIKLPSNAPAVLSIYRQPVEITGRYYGLVQFVSAIANSDRFSVRHFNRDSRQFDGDTEIMRLPPVLLASAYGSYPSTTHLVEQSPLNETGWYIYGAKDAAGVFVVQAWCPRSLLRLQPDRVVFGYRPSYRYIRKEAWAEAAAHKGKISSVLCVANSEHEDIQPAIASWQAGDQALVLHVYGGIGGKRKEPAAATPIFFGHFAYGLATVIHDPLSDELRFEIMYEQVYSQNTDGLTAGTLHWSRYMGDRQFGWLGSRPVCDILVKFAPFTGKFDFDGQQRSALTVMSNHLQVMTARYRIGDGTGATFVGPANNCAQDSNQALFASIRAVEQAVSIQQPALQAWLAREPEQAQRFRALLALGKQLRYQLQPFGAPRADWQANEFNLGSSMEDEPLRNLWTGLGSWRTVLPRKASDAIVQVFLRHGASVWVLRTNQVGGYDPEIEPIAPMTL